MSTHQFQNVASGNAQVGVQIGQNTGSVTVGRPAAAGAELDRLLDAIRQAHQRGELDADTLSEAEHEISVARAAPDPGRAARALRRLGGMLDGVAGLGALAGAVAAAVESLGS
ncbi:hypothetical protein AB0F81_17890 [Actinoplanes sp. NPDC024001]|uniref:hypothetical protein n=1 Tax=Actinoplanes sp. NPDC024001 TaxID=3154598 RepID=UPI0033F49F8F